MISDPLFTLALGFLTFSFFVWLTKRNTPKYVVLKKNPEAGTEVRYNGRSIYIHVLDKALFDAQLKKSSDEIWESLKKQGYTIKD